MAAAFFKGIGDTSKAILQVVQVVDAGTKAIETLKKDNLTPADVTNVAAQTAYVGLQTVSGVASLSQTLNVPLCSPSTTAQLEIATSAGALARTTTQIVANPTPEPILDITSAALSHGGEAVATINREMIQSTELEVTATICQTLGYAIAARELIGRVVGRIEKFVKDSPFVEGHCVSSDSETQYYYCESCDHKEKYWWSDCLLGRPRRWTRLSWEASCRGCEGETDYVRGDIRNLYKKV